LSDGDDNDLNKGNFLKGMKIRYLPYYNLLLQWMDIHMKNTPLKNG